MPEIQGPCLELFRGLAVNVRQYTQGLAEAVRAEGLKAGSNEVFLDHLTDFSRFGVGIAGQVRVKEPAIILAHKRLGEESICRTEQLIFAQELNPFTEALQVRGPCGANDEFLLADTAQNLRKLAKIFPVPQQRRKT